MFEKNPALTLMCTAVACLAIGLGLGYALKPIPEPTIEVGPGWSLKVNGKAIDLGKLQFGPLKRDEGGKKKSGDLPAGELERPAAVHFAPAVPGCPCGESCSCTICTCSRLPVSVSQVADHPVVGQRGGGTEFLGLEKIVDRLIAWLADKGARTEEAIAAREAELAKKWESFKLTATGVIVAAIIPAFGIWYSVHRIANASEARVLQGIGK